jgi:hypothetical protein
MRLPAAHPVRCRRRAAAAAACVAWQRRHEHDLARGMQAEAGYGKGRDTRTYSHHACNASMDGEQGRQPQARRAWLPERRTWRLCTKARPRPTEHKLLGSREAEGTGTCMEGQQWRGRVRYSSEEALDGRGTLHLRAPCSRCRELHTPCACDAVEANLDN